MKRTTKITILTAALLAAFPLQAQTGRTADVQFKAAEYKEQVEGDLKGAIEQYKMIAQSRDRSIAVQALMRMAECYQKMGGVESHKIYEQVVKDFADQKEAVAVARARLGVEPGNNEQRMSFRQIWTLPTRGEAAGAISRDGRYLPYIEWKDSADLFLHDFSSNTNRRLTDTARTSPPGEQYPGQTSFSPDGKLLAYLWYRPGSIPELRLIDLQAEGIPKPQLLFSNEDVSWIVPADWSPDGKTIAVKIQRSDKTGQIGLVSVAGGALRVLKSVDWRGPTKLAFSPDGKYLAYDLPADDHTEQRDIFVLAADGTREIPAVVSPSQDTVIGWSNDGTRLLFASDRGGSNGLWSVPFVGGKLNGRPELLRRDIGRISSLGFTAGGKLYTSFNSADRLADIHVATVDFATGKLISPPSLAVQTSMGTNEFPAWSRDGKYLAYISQRRSVGQHHTVIGIRSMETGEVKEIAPSGLNRLSWLAWTPDGVSLAVSGTDPKGRSGIFKVDAQTGQISILVEKEEGAYIPVRAGFSPDGRKVYYITRYLKTAEWVSIEKDLVTGSQKELFHSSNWMNWIISPDGRYLAGVDPAKPKSLFILPASGGAHRELLIDADVRQFRGLEWAADSTALYRIRVMASHELWRLPVDGSEPQKVDLKWDADNLGVGMICAHPDGQRVVFDSRSASKPQEIWALQNFLPTLAANN